MVVRSRFACELCVDTTAARVTHHIELLVHGEISGVVSFVRQVGFDAPLLARKLFLNLAFSRNWCFLLSFFGHFWLLTL